jgi:hypothetical protein
MTPLVLSLLLAAPWKPLPPGAPTVWAQAGATGWITCEDLARQATAARGGSGGRAESVGEPRAWLERASRCPNAPEILILAAQHEIIDAGRLGVGPEPGGGSLQPLVDEHTERVGQALDWLDTALRECARRRESPPREARYLRAYALSALGRPKAARAALDDAIAHAEIERWRSDRMGAAIALFAGDIDLAMRLGQRAAIDTPSDDRTITRYLRALVLDRAGASAAARTELLDLRVDVGHIVARDAAESLLPLHERLYLRALERQANDDNELAVVLWDAYLARPEPEEPERLLAQRHRATLVKRPVPVR